MIPRQVLELLNLCTKLDADLTHSPQRLTSSNFNISSDCFVAHKNFQFKSNPMLWIFVNIKIQSKVVLLPKLTCISHNNQLIFTNDIAGFVSKNKMFYCCSHTVVFAVPDVFRVASFP